MNKKILIEFDGVERERYGHIYCEPTFEFKFEEVNVGIGSVKVECIMTPELAQDMYHWDDVWIKSNQEFLKKVIMERLHMKAFDYVINDTIVIKL